MKFLWAMEKCGLCERVATWEHSWLENCVERAVTSAQPSDGVWSGSGASQCFHQRFLPAALLWWACKSDFLEKLEKSGIKLSVRTNIRLLNELGKITITSTSWGKSKVALWESSWRWQWIPQGTWDSSIPSEKSEIRLGCINKVFVRHLMWSRCT